MTPDDYYFEEEQINKAKIIAKDILIKLAHEFDEEGGLAVCLYTLGIVYSVFTKNLDDFDAEELIIRFSMILRAFRQ